MFERFDDLGFVFEERVLEAVDVDFGRGGVGLDTLKPLFFDKGVFDIERDAQGGDEGISFSLASVIFWVR